MDGDIAPLDEITKLADEYGAMVLVDDCHGEGVLGESGAGIVDHFGLQGKVDFEIGSFSKALGCLLYTSPSPRDAHESRMPSSA